MDVAPPYVAGARVQAPHGEEGRSKKRIFYEGDRARPALWRNTWVLAWAAVLLGCPRTAPAPSGLDAASGPVGPACPTDAWSPADRCALARAVFHLKGPQGHEVEWYATECDKWPVKVDVAVRCGGKWAPWFGDGVAPDCQDEQFVTVNLRTQTAKARGLWLQLSPSDAGFAFRLTPAQLVPSQPGGEPRQLDALCGDLSGDLFPLDGGFVARTRTP
jgi:hypothetical protein